MKVYITLGYTTGVFLVFTHCEPENNNEIKNVKEISDRLNVIIKQKLNGTPDDDDNFKLIDYGKEYKDRVERVIKRCIKTVSKETGIILKYYINFVEEEY